MVLGVKEPGVRQAGRRAPAASAGRLRAGRRLRRHGPAVPLGSCARLAPLDGIDGREGFTSIWHRNPTGQWTFYESVPSVIACTRYFGADVARVKIGPIAVDWEGDRRLDVHTVESPAVD